MKTFSTAHLGRTLLLSSIATIAPLGTVNAQFLASSNLQSIESSLLDSSTVNIEPVGLNQERAAPGHGEPIPNGKHFQISVDGQTVDGSVGTAEDDQRAVDVALDSMDIRLSYDGLELQRVANVEAQARSLEAGVQHRPVVFTPYWNYGSFIQRAEVRIFPVDSGVAEFSTGASTKKTPLEVLPVTAGKRVDWIPSVDFAEKYGEVQYVLRMYDDKGNFDETRPKKLNLTHLQHGRGGDVAPFNVEALIGYDKNSLNVQNIDVFGGAVTVKGHHVPSGSRVFVMGREVPVNSSGEFVLREIVHSGSHNVTIAVLDKNGQGLEFQRNLYVPDNDFFYIGLGDLTVGTNDITGPAGLLTDADADEDVYVDGRAASGRDEARVVQFQIAVGREPNTFYRRDCTRVLDDCAVRCRGGNTHTAKTAAKKLTAVEDTWCYSPTVNIDRCWAGDDPRIDKVDPHTCCAFS